MFLCCSTLKIKGRIMQIIRIVVNIVLALSCWLVVASASAQQNMDRIIVIGSRIPIYNSDGDGGGRGTPREDQAQAPTDNVYNADKKTDEVVEKYELPCKKANQSVEAYTATTIANCTSVSYQRTLDENPGLRLVPASVRLIILEQIGEFCTIRVNEQVGSGKIKSC
jgi:hypothetical protein